MKCHPLFAAVLSCLSLSGCVTAEYQQAAAQCRNAALGAYPVVLEQRIFRRSREVMVPDGSTVCESRRVESRSEDAERRRSEPRERKDAEDRKNDRERRDNAERERRSTTQVSVSTTTNVCRPGMRPMVEYYDEPGTVDVNSDGRERYVADCAASLCMQQFGNARCKQ